MNSSATITANQNRKNSATLILLLSIILLLSLWWLGRWVARFGRESLQMDLTAFYTAGESLNHGLSPYRNHIARDPPIWDGKAEFQHSRFLYPPQVAVLFRPLARLPYATAKRLWMLLCLAAVAVSLSLTMRVYGLRGRWTLILAISICAVFFYPLLTHLERGQIDALTLLLIVGASVWIGKRTPRPEFGAGVLLCAATLLKLHCAFMLPFLAIRKKGWALLGYLAGGAVIVGLTAVTPGGIEATLDYVRDELPRISRFAEWGTAEELVPEEILQDRLRGLSGRATIKDGVVYKKESFFFFPGGTLVWVLLRPLHNANIWISPSLVSTVMLATQLGAMVVWQRRQSGPLRLEARGEFLYWHVVALIILLCAPTTWIMNLVWLLPLIVVVLTGFAGPLSRQAKPALIGAAVALAAIALPSWFEEPWLTPTLNLVFRDKNVVAELVLLFSLLGYLPHLPRGATAGDKPGSNP